MKLLGVGLLAVGTICLTSCSVASQDSVDPITSGPISSSPIATATPAANATPVGASADVSVIDSLPRCPSVQSESLDQLVTALVRVNAGQTDLALARNNVEMFVNNLAQSCGATYTTQQRQVLVKELVSLTVDPAN